MISDFYVFLGVPGALSLEMNITSPAVAAIRLHTVFFESYGFSDMTTSPDEDKITHEEHIEWRILRF